MCRLHVNPDESPDRVYLGFCWNGSEPHRSRPAAEGPQRRCGWFRKRLFINGFSVLFCSAEELCPENVKSNVFLVVFKGC